MERNDDPVPGQEYTVRLIDLGPQIRGVTVQDEDGYNNIYINARHSRLVQLRALNHEITHLRRRDFDRWNSHKGE